MSLTDVSLDLDHAMFRALTCGTRYYVDGEHGIAFHKSGINSVYVVKSSAEEFEASSLFYHEGDVIERETEGWDVSVHAMLKSALGSSDCRLNFTGPDEDEPERGVSYWTRLRDLQTTRRLSGAPSKVEDKSGAEESRCTSRKLTLKDLYELNKFVRPPPRIARPTSPTLAELSEDGRRSPRTPSSPRLKALVMAGFTAPVHGVANTLRRARSMSLRPHSRDRRKRAMSP